MQQFTIHTGLVVPLDRVNVDTDQIIPKQFLKRIERTGFGQFVFYDWRYLEGSIPNPDFILNQPKYRRATILVTGSNFGCGSSREHAPWALEEYGFRAIIAPSFADIFRSNCYQNGMLPIELKDTAVDEIMGKALRRVGYEVTADLQTQTVHDGYGLSEHFDIDPFRRDCLLSGLDDIGLTLEHEDAIEQFEGKRDTIY